MTYTSPFQAGGETVQFYSTDNAGNNEEVQSIDVPGVVVPVIVTQTVAETPQVSSRGGGGAIILIPAILQTQAMQIEDETQAMSPQSEPADNKLVATVISPLLKTALASSEPVEDVSVVTENDAVSSTALTATAESSGSNTKPLIVLGSIGGLCLLAFFAKKLFV
jgi:hypothetical protein